MTTCLIWAGLPVSPSCSRKAASWAGLLEAAHRAVGDRVLFLGVDSRDSRSVALRFLTASNVTYAQVFDEAGTLGSRLGLQGIPDTLMVDASGRIVDRWFGELTAEHLRDGLSRLGVSAGDTQMITAHGRGSMRLKVNGTTPVDVEENRT